MAVPRVVEAAPLPPARRRALRRATLLALVFSCFALVTGAALATGRVLNSPSADLVLVVSLVVLAAFAWHTAAQEWAFRWIR